MRDIFVGILFIVGVFLIFYSAYDDKIDNWITNFAGLFAICIGVFPMDPSYHPNVLNDSINILGSQCYQNHGPLGFHMLAASAFFVLIGILTIFRFTKSNDSNRNYVYILCGSVMLISIVWIFFAKLHEQSASIFWPETFAIISFTAAWLIKGGAYATINNGSRVLLKRLF